MVVTSSPVEVTKTLDIAPVSNQEFLDIKANIECGFTLKSVRDMTRTCSQIQCTDKYSKFSSIIWSIWSNELVLVYELSGFGFESRCSHLNFGYCARFD